MMERLTYFLQPLCIHQAQLVGTCGTQRMFSLHRFQSQHKWKCKTIEMYASIIGVFFHLRIAPIQRSHLNTKDFQRESCLLKSCFLHLTMCSTFMEWILFQYFRKQRTGLEILKYRNAFQKSNFEKLGFSEIFFSSIFSHSIFQNFT